MILDQVIDKKLVLFIILSFPGMCSSYDTDYTHPDVLTLGAVDLIAPFNNDSKSLYSEIRSFSNNENGKSNDLRDGSIEEDGTFGPSTNEPYFRPVSVLNHFYNPQTRKGILGANSSLEIIPYFWNKGISEYFKGKKDKGYYYLGRAAHFVEDVGSGPHSHADLHMSVSEFLDRNVGFGRNDFEHWVSARKSYASRFVGTHVEPGISPTQILHDTAYYTKEN